jgi:O-antigen ligase
MRTLAFILLWLYVFTLPWDYTLQFGDPIGSAGRVAGLLALAGWLLLIGTHSRMRRPRVFHIAAAVYLAIVAASLFWTTDPESTVQCVRSYVQSVMVVWVIWEVGDTQRALFHLAIAYVGGATVAAFSIFQNFSLATVEAGAREARFAADNWDANDIALALALAIPLAFYIASKRRYWITTCLALSYLVVGPMAILLTSSRGGIVVMAIAFFALPLFLKRQSKTAKVMALIVLVCAGCVAFYYVPQQSWDRLSTVFDNLRAGDLNSRETIWQDGLRAFGSKYAVGVGAGAFQAGVGTFYNAHNTFLAVLVEQGVIGFSVFFVILACAVRGSVRALGEERWLSISLVVCWAIGVFTLGWATTRITWFVLALVVSFGSADKGRQSSELDLDGVTGFAVCAE